MELIITSKKLCFIKYPTYLSFNIIATTFEFMNWDAQINYFHMYFKFHS